MKSNQTHQTNWTDQTDLGEKDKRGNEMERYDEMVEAMMTTAPEREKDVEKVRELKRRVRAALKKAADLWEPLKWICMDHLWRPWMW